MEILRELVLAGTFGIVIFALFLSASQNIDTTGAAATLPSYTNTCTDTDSMNPSVRGVVSGNQNGVQFKYIDECSSDSISIREFYCDGSSPASVWAKCQDYCANGACQ